MARGPVISITYRAGNGKFIEDSIKVKASIKSVGDQAKETGKAVADMGHSGVTGVQATSGALRVLEGGLNNNLRAAERFAANILGLGPILQAAFPLIGGIAFAGLLVRLGEEAHKFYATLRDAPEKAAGGFRVLNAGARETNDALELSNIQLQNQINKLEGKHENTVKVALFEARQEADKLAASLEKDMEALHKFLDANGPGFSRRLLDTVLGNAPPEALKAADKFKVEMGGYGGQAGATERIASINEQANVELSAAAHMPTGTPDESKAAILAKENAERTRTNALQAEYKKQLESISAYQKILTDLQEHQWKQQAEIKASGSEGVAQSDTNINWGTYIAPLIALRQRIQSMMTTVDLSQTHGDLKGKVDELTAQRVNNKEDSPYTKKVEDLKAAIAEAQAKIIGTGLDETGKLLEKVKADTIGAIKDVNKAWEGKGVGTRVNDEQSKTLSDLVSKKDQAEAAAKLAEKTSEVRDRIAEEIVEYNLLNDAIGKGWEAQKKVNTEIELRHRFGAPTLQAAIDNPGGDAAADVAGARSQISIAQENKHTDAIKENVRALANQAAMERVLADAQALGAYAVDRAALAEKIRQGQGISGAEFSPEQQKAMWDEFNASQLKSASEEVAKINEKVAATQRLTAATLVSADAMRNAVLAGRLNEISRNDPTGQKGAAALREAQAEHAEELARDAIQTDRVRKIDDEIAKLTDAKTTLGNTLAIQEQLNELENQRIQALVEESLKMRGLQDGVRAFFLEMQEQGKSTANIIYEALNSALDRSSENLAKMAVDKKPKGGYGEMFGKEFQGIGESMVSSSIKGLASKGLGELKKPDGTQGNPIWIRNADDKLFNGVEGTAQDPFSKAGGAAASKAAGLGGASSPIQALLQKLFHIGNGGGAAAGAAGAVTDNTGDLATSLGDLPMMAGGGDVSPGQPYIVGEQRPELFVPSTSGRIVPKLEGGGGGQGNTYVTQIDARDSDLGVMNRLARAQQAQNRQTEARAVQGTHERSKRVPGR